LKAEKEAERLKREKLETDFTELLTESTAAGLINGRMRVPDAEPVLCEDPRFLAFSDRSKDRDAMLDEYLYKLYQTGKAEKEKKRADALAALDALLTELQKDGKITHESRWSQLEPLLDSLNDPRAEAVEVPEDREAAVRAFLRVLADEARQLRRKLEEEHKEQIRVRRRAFGDWLKVRVCLFACLLAYSWRQTGNGYMLVLTE
jgi:glycine/D-amino acid oxidase-like deaminating enzyme